MDDGSLVEGDGPRRGPPTMAATARLRSAPGSRIARSLRPAQERSRQERVSQPDRGGRFLEVGGRTARDRPTLAPQGGGQRWRQESRTVRKSFGDGEIAVGGPRRGEQAARLRASSSRSASPRVAAKAHSSAWTQTRSRSYASARRIAAVSGGSSGLVRSASSERLMPTRLPPEGAGGSSRPAAQWKESRPVRRG